MNAPGYEQLSEVLRAAFDQAAYGKGAERHARGNDFDKQHMQTISTLLGTERGMAFQVCKKLTEGLDMEAYDRFERELLGVIIYTAGIIIWRKKNSPPTAEVVKPDVAHCPHCGASELHQLTCPTQSVIPVNLGTALSPPIDPADGIEVGPPTCHHCLSRSPGFHKHGCVVGGYGAFVQYKEGQPSAYDQHDRGQNPPAPIDPADVDISGELPPDQWQKGDVVVALHNCDGQFSRLKRYTLRSANELQTVKVVADDRGDENGWGEHNFRFHSRPTK